MVQQRITRFFQTSMETGTLPSQWEIAKIIRLKQPGKDDYSQAKAWRPISLLCALGKALESILAERISYLVTQKLLPNKHFSARKQRDTEQALILLQERIFKAWRSRRVLSLITFDIKGAYNGVSSSILAQRLQAHGIPDSITRWVRDFCSDQTATTIINGTTMDKKPLPHAGCRKVPHYRPSYSCSLMQI